MNVANKPESRNGRADQLLEGQRGDAWEDPAVDGGTSSRRTDQIGILLSDVQPRGVEWLWPGRIPLGKLTIIDGDPGLGKSVLTLDLAARVSRGWPMPCGAPGRQGGVVLLSAEDGLDDTIAPRLQAAGADCSRILALDSIPCEGGRRMPILPLDAHYIRGAIESVCATLVVVDPLTAYLAAEINSHRDQDCRRALVPLVQVAEDTGAAVVVIRHLNKAAGGNPLYRGGGSIGIIGAARSGLLVAKDPDDDNRRVLAPTKCNLAKKASSLVYRLETADNGALLVRWEGVSTHSADDLLAVPNDQGERDAVMGGEQVLREILAHGPMPAEQARQDARRAGVSARTLDRAKAALGVKSQKTASGWHWELPAKDAKDAKP